jgi:ribonuclease III
VRNQLGETGHDILGAIGELHEAFNRTKPSHASTEENTQNATTSTSLKAPARGVPQLPPILDVSLERAVFTHPGIINDQITDFPGSLNYDRLEILGDAYIELIATKLIWNRFHDLPSGRISQIREGLVKNETLAEYATMYGFDKKALVPKGHLAQGKRSIKTKGDIFEAYVAAIILSDKTNGYQAAESWLSELWMPKLTEATEKKQKLQSKESLAKKIMSRGVRLEYIDEEPPVIQKGGPQIFAVGVYLTGWGWYNHHLGSGQGPSKAIAGDQAAHQALLNKPFIDELAVLKNAHDSLAQGHKRKR